MSQQPIGPERRKFLELCCKLIKARESAIRYGARHIRFKGDPRYTDPFSRQRQMNLCEKINSRGFHRYAEALMCLKLARSRMAVELEGKQWQA
jgi:hypothetical protein